MSVSSCGHLSPIPIAIIIIATLSERLRCDRLYVVYIITWKLVLTLENSLKEEWHPHLTNKVQMVREVRSLTCGHAMVKSISES